MVIRGKVLDRCCKPVSNAKVSIWYAGDLGQEGKNDMNSMNSKCLIFNLTSCIMQPNTPFLEISFGLCTADMF